MKAAFSYEGKRIAPVFDVARHIFIVEAEAGKIICEFKKKMDNELHIQNTIRIAETGIETLICGAVSTSLHNMISSYGISVIPFVTGELREVINAWINGNLNCEVFFMPGYRNHGFRGGRQQRRPINKELIMNQDKRAEIGRGGGQGRGNCGLGSPRGQNKSGICLCPSCGKNMPHERGNPCFEIKCPECGTAMTRG